MNIKSYVTELVDALGNVFITGMHIQMLIDRSVGNTNKGSKRWVNKLVSFDRKEYIQNCEILLEQASYIWSTSDKDVRLYSTINSRCFESVVKAFLCDAISNGSESFYRDIRNRFVSCAMKPEQRDNDLWLIDVDDLSLVDKVESLLHGCQLERRYKTKKGMHYIIHKNYALTKKAEFLEDIYKKKFTVTLDMRVFNELQNVDIHRDGLMLLFWRESE